MVATRILLATAFCLFSDGVKAADPKMRVDSRVISAAGVVSDEASYKRKPLARREHQEHQEHQEFQPSFSDLAKVTQLGTDLKIAYEAIIAAVELFKAGSYTEGTDAVIDAAVAFLEKYSPETAAQFTEAVTRLQTSVARAQSIMTELQNFKRTGDSQALASALQDILKEVEAVAEDAGNDKAVQVIQGFEIVINGTAEYWGSIKNAEDPAAAIEDLYDALKESAILIIGEENSDKLDTLFVALDATIGNLTSIVESYKRELEQKELCLKIYKPETSRPDTCPEGKTVRAGKCMASASASALEGEFWDNVKTWFQSSKTAVCVWPRSVWPWQKMPPTIPSRLHPRERQRLRVSNFAVSNDAPS